jgi:purine-binding chemotaxis protein CheW
LSHESHDWALKWIAFVHFQHTKKPNHWTSNMDTAPHTPAKTPNALAMAGGEHLVFRIGQQEYGFEILSVREIRSYEAPTKMVNAPACVKGVIDLRNTIIPIVDLRMKMGFHPIEPTNVTVVIVVSVLDTVLGMVADSVSDVVDVHANELHEAPPSSVDQLSVVRALASIKREGGQGERMVTLLNLEKLAEDLIGAKTSLPA